jgi:tRNA 5-methylaminomethyl-2-thiouridine biosynthesis bifunctional protein
MKTRPIVPVTLHVNDDGVPTSPEYGDVYHPRQGAFVQARHVFLSGNALPSRWQGRTHFVVMETGFGLGNNFLATWQAWRDDPKRPQQLVFLSVEQQPFRTEDLRRAHANSPAPELAGLLVDAWPPLTHDLHTLEFEQGRVRLLLALGDLHAWLPELVARVDAFYLDGFAPVRNPRMWEDRVFKALARLAAPGATLATWTSVGAVRHGLRSAGFEVRKVEGRDGKRHITLARYAPTFTPRHAPARQAAASTRRHALVVGAGLAGCAMALALAREGWTSTVFDRQAAPACETSGNPAGLFHGIVTPEDGAHARFNRAAALLARQVVDEAIARGVPGQRQGLLRLDKGEVGTLRERLAALGLPGDFVQAADAAQAHELSGLPLQQPAWFYPGGGWVDPSALARSWLAQAGDQARLQPRTAVSTLRREGEGWALLDADGRVIDSAEVVVLANAGDALRLLGATASGWPIASVRGQLSWLDAPALRNLALPSRPIAGAGYVVPMAAGRLLFGAASQHGDEDPSVRESDQRANLAQLSRLLPIPEDIPATALHGRTGWRSVADDRLPVVGAVPDRSKEGERQDQARLVPRVPGLYVFTALGSRGITWAPLAARVLASLICGSPPALGADLVDAIDPARFTVRQARRGGPRSGA